MGCIMAAKPKRAKTGVKPQTGLTTEEATKLLKSKKTKK